MISLSLMVFHLFIWHSDVSVHIWKTECRHSGYSLEVLGTSDFIKIHDVQFISV